MRVARLKETYPTAKVELWCEDEHRPGLKSRSSAGCGAPSEKGREFRPTSVTSGPTPLRLRAPENRRGPLVDPPHGERGGVLDGFGELRQGSWSGQRETRPARARSSGLAHGKEEAEGPRRDTPGVPTLAFPGATTLRKAMAAFRRRGCENRHFERRSRSWRRRS
jgi:hypothetical protein